MNPLVFATCWLSLFCICSVTSFAPSKTLDPISFVSSNFPISINALSSPQTKPTTSLIQSTTPKFPPSRYSTKLYGWGPDPIWSICSVSLTSSCSDPAITKINMAHDRPEGHTNGGQYVQMRASGKEDTVGYYAISTPVGSSSMDFYVKLNDNNQYLSLSSDTVSVEVSQVLGGGFNSDIVDSVDELYVVCTGTGIAPCYSYLMSNKDRLKGKTIKVFWGTKTDSFGSDIAASLESVGAVVERTYSGAKQPYVQDVFAGSILTPSSAGVMVVGQKEMFESVKSHCEDVGVGEGRVFSNF